MRTIALDFPKSILIETCNICQGKCIFCPYSNIRKGNDIYFLEKDIIERLLYEIKKYYVERISLFNNNEPLLDNRIYEIIRTTRNILPSVEITLSTNGILLKEETVKKLYLAGLSALYISIPTLIDKDYKTIMGYNINHILEVIRNLHNSKYTKIIKIAIPKALSFNPDEFKKEFTEKGIEICPWEIEYITNWKLNLSEMRQYFAMNKTTVSCDRPMDQAVITSNGNMLLCCRDWHEEIILGNIKSDTIYNIWHNNKTKAIQKSISKQEYNKISLCRKCSMAKVNLSFDTPR
jgi:radical SAM protein with 4Fe4S-binding SPASM domain